MLLLICAVDTTAQTDSLQIWIESFSTLKSQRSFELAENISRKIETYYLKEEEWLGYIQYVSETARFIQQRDKIENALLHLDNAIGRVKEGDDNIGLQAKALGYHKKGVLFYYGFLYDDAIQAFDAALQIRASLFTMKHRDIIKGLHNIGDCYWLQGYVEQAQIYLDSSLQIHLTTDTISETQLSLTHKVLGLVLSEKGEYDQAEQHYLAALNLYETIHRDAPWELAKIYVDLSRFYLDANDNRNVKQFARNAIAQINSIDEKYDEDNKSLADAFHNLALALTKDSTEVAIGHINKAIDINEKFELRLGHLINNYSALVAINLERGNIQAAERASEQALQKAKNTDLKVYKSMAFNSQAFYELSVNNYQAAEEAQRKAMNELVYLDANANEIIINKRFYYDYLSELSDMLFEASIDQNGRDYLEKSYNTYNHLFSSLLELRASYGSESSKIERLSRAKNQIEKCIRISFRLFEESRDIKYANGLLSTMQLSKSLVLLEATLQNSNRFNKDISPQLLREEQKHLADLYKIEQQLAEVNSDSIQLALVNEWKIGDNMLKKVRLKIAAEDPQFYALQFPVFSNSTVKEVQENLHSDLFIEYFQTDTGIYSIVITSDTVIINHEVLDTSLLSYINTLNNCIKSEFTIGNVDCNFKSEFPKVAHKLYNVLLADAMKIQRGNSICIITDGLLGNIPFEALLEEIPQTDNMSKWPFVRNKYQLSYQYSSKMLSRYNKEHSVTKDRKIVALAPTFTESDELGVLLHNSDEINAISKFWPVHKLSGKKAQKNLFIIESKSAAVIHISSHAILDLKNSDNSFIAFKNDTSVEKLYVEEIYPMLIPAEMVVLSACEAAIGEYVEGEGIASIARAFTYAGAQSLISTLWSVNDQKSADMMAYYYEFLKEGHTKDKALWLAKDRMIHQDLNAHPYYWASTVAYGKMDRLEIKKSRPLITGITSLLIAAIGVFAFRKRIFGQVIKNN